MQYYYRLQYKRIFRVLKALGLEPVIVIPLCFVLFYWVSNLLFDISVYADIGYSILAVLISFLSNHRVHNEFVKSNFSKTGYRIIIICNRLLIIFPFVCVLIFKSCFLLSFLLSTATLLVSFFSVSKNINVVIPTPFYKKPYEFIIGFRNSFWVYLFIYALAIIAIKVDNFNLGVFAILAVFFVNSGYYMKPDPQFYIWIHTMNPKEFLKYKILIALRHSALLIVFPLIILSLFYYSQLDVVLFFLMLGVLYMVVNILVRYAFTGGGGSFFQSIISVLSVLFPPIMILFIPYFYSKALINLKKVLYDRN